MHEFWGKTADADYPQAYSYKPVIHHLLDVAAVALRLQLGNPSRLKREAALLGIPADRLAPLSALLAGLHDLGKFALSFQSKVPTLWRGDLWGPHAARHVTPHWRNTAVLLRTTRLAAEFEMLFPRLHGGQKVLIASIAGHHGRPTNDEHFRDPTLADASPELGPLSVAAALETFRTLRDILRVDPVPELDEPETVQAWSWRLAGLTTLADWVGSDAHIFSFERPEMSATDYWPLALARANVALAEKGLIAAAPTSAPCLSDIAPQILNPRPMQVDAEALPLGEGPQLAIIEDATGSGKTEAALVLAARMMATGKGEGIYFALPTMATANAMYERLGNLHSRLFAKGTRPSLVLAHGRAELERGFLKTVGPVRNGAGEEDNAAWCSAWIADSRRRAFFADVGAGTIDQALLAILRKKHLTLRQYGLAGRILLVDEAHSFDAYLGKELEVLIEAHAANGGSVIILSATLPEQKRQVLVQAFRRGLGLGRRADTPLPKCEAYPLVTLANRAGVELRDAVEFDGSLRRTVSVTRVPDGATGISRALAAAEAGAAVLIIRNAVDEAIAAFELVRARHAATRLFHARFAVVDRQRIESEIMHLFGADAEADKRAGRILVATQVVEQSLDLDFDLIVTDLAPVDLVIQRAGRLWRHMEKRPAAGRPMPGPELVVISPDAREAPAANWLAPALGGGAFVYRHPGVMWRSARALFSAGAIHTPGNLRALIGQVYDSEEVPEGFEQAQNVALGEEYGARSHAGHNTVRVRDGYSGLGELADDQEIGTRLGQDTTTLRLARLLAGRIVPWAEDCLEPWAMSEVSVRTGWLRRRQIDLTPPEALLPLMVAARRDWPEWEKAQIVVVEESGSVAAGRGGDRDHLTYDPEVGLRCTDATPPSRLPAARATARLCAAVVR